MNKAIKLSMVLGLVFGLAGCGGGGDDDAAKDGGGGDGGLRLDGRVADSSVAVDSGDPDGCGPNGEDDGQGGCLCDEGYYNINDGGICLPPPACLGADDLLEPNDTPQTGTMLTATTVTTGLRVCPANDDWYRVTLAAGQKLTADVVFTPAMGDLDVYLWPAGADLVNDNPVAFSENVTEDENIMYTATTAGEYWMLVYGYEAAQNTYSMTITKTP